MNFEPMNTEVASNVTVRGTKYKKNMFVLISDSDEGLVAGKIKLILIHQGVSLHFVTQKYQAVRLPKMDVYRITPAERTCCVDLRNMLDYYPLLEYTGCLY